jgi:hypothetical protein
MNARLNNGQANKQQVMADSELLLSDYNNLIPQVGGFGPAGYTLNRSLADQSFSWLDRARSLYGSDPQVSESLLRTYGFIGDFYQRYGASFYPGGAALGYAGANQLARSLVLNGGNGKRFERDLERYALAWATADYVGGALYGRPPAYPDTRRPYAGGLEAPQAPMQPLALPAVDESKLDAGQKALWTDVRERFVTVSANVHEAQVLLAQLSARLHSQNLKLNPQDAATGIKMQGFLEDAVELIGAGNFEQAKEALIRADYERQKLKSVTGQ